MRNNKGQTTSEMVFLLPLLVMMASAMIFFVYAGWQDLRVQQAANLLARVEGQEKVSGGRSVGAINAENGFGPGTGIQDANADLNGGMLDVSGDTHITSGGSTVLFERMRNLLRGIFPAGLGNGGGMSAPRSGQNIDQITITRVLKMPRLPFLKQGSGIPETITLKGTAYGGEDPFMYALPRWGTTSDSQAQGGAEWRVLLKDAATHERAQE